MTTEPTIEQIITEWESTLRYGFALAQLRTGSEDAAMHALIEALEGLWSEDDANLPSRKELLQQVARGLPLQQTA